MKRVGILIDPIKIEQTSDSIKLGGYPLYEYIWTAYRFWDALRLYTDLFDSGDGIKIEEKNNGFFINNKPITKDNQPIRNARTYKEYLTNNPIFKLEPAN
jgi:hypothetical protein